MQFHLNPWPIKVFFYFKYTNLVIGNSSSGLIEVPSFGIPTINIGDRQKGRIKAKSVIDLSPNKKKYRTSYC